ncbi:uncharacterized protein [Coffea arabica]|uniref:Uncharacterized protein n=1 Tax=Coffea arabica TaxID=13443 RepID=A0A6P6T6R3_COFAR
MDHESKGRTWIGNIYHKFEAICQDVDDFVTKDNAKYVKNQVQTVGESMRTLYSNVVLDFQSSLEDIKQAKVQSGTIAQNNALGNNTRYILADKEKQRHASERGSSKEQDKVDFRSCDPDEVDHLGQLSPPPSADLSQVVEKDLHRREMSDAAFQNKIEMVLEENVKREDYLPTSNLNYPKDENSSELPLYWREQHQPTDNLEFPVDNYLYGPLDTFNEGDQRKSFQAEFSPKVLVEDVELRTSGEDYMKCNGTDFSEETETYLVFEQDGEIAISKESKICAEDNDTVQERPASEHASSSEAKNLWELLWTQEQPDCYDSYALKDRSTPMRCSTDDDKKSSDLGKCSPEILVPDNVLGIDPVEHLADSNADPAEEAVKNLALEHNGSVGSTKHGMGLKENGRKENLVVDDRSYSSYGSSFDFSSHPREKHSKAADSNSLLDKGLCESLHASMNDEYWPTIQAKSSPETSLNDEGLRASEEEEGEYNRPSCSNETETESDFSLDGYCSCMSSNFDVEDNGFGEKHAAPEVLGCPGHNSIFESYLCSSKLQVENDDFSSQNGESSPGLSPISRKEDHIITNSANFSPVSSVNDAGVRAFLKNETICNSLSDVLSTNLSSELVSSDTCWELKVAQTESSNYTASTELLDLLELPQANSSQKIEEVCFDDTDSTDCSSALSSISCASFSGLTSGNTAVSGMPAFPMTTYQQPFTGIFDDSVNDIDDAEMETIDLSDEVKVEDSCVVMDNEILHAVSCRPRKFRSFKKLIQEAFASRRRLIKEYEQLSIRFGDIEADTSFHSEQFLSPYMPSASRPSQAHDLGESEWELL